MCNLLPFQWICKVAVMLGIGVFLLLLFYYHPAAELWAVARIAFQAAGITTFLLLAVAKWDLWRLVWNINPRFFNRAVFPDLQGHYRGSLTSSYTTPPTQIDDVELTIRQRLTKISVRLKTKGSESSTEIAQIIPVDRDEGRYQLFYLYRNEPKSSERPALAPHMGGAELNIDLSSQQIRLTGRYFNDTSMRETHGDMDFKRYTKRLK